jgi:uncharacterized heparinase superfamily protein
MRTADQFYTSRFHNHPDVPWTGKITHEYIIYRARRSAWIYAEEMLDHERLANHARRLMEIELTAIKIWGDL